MVGRFAPSRAEAQELARSSLQRRTQNLMPLGIGVIAGPISRTISDPDRRASAGRSLQGFARDVQTLPSLDYGRIANDTGQQISEGVRNLPRLAGEVVRNLPTIVRAATYGPIEDEELAQQRLELARMRGDASGARNAADAANANTALAAVNVGAPILAGPTPSLLRTSAVAAGATAPFAFSGSEPLQERIPRGIAQTTGAAALGAGLQQGASIVLNGGSRAVNALRARRYRQNEAALDNRALETDIAPMTQGERLGDLTLQQREQRMRYGMGGSEESQRTLSQFDVERAQALRDRVLTGVGERGGNAVTRSNESIPGDLESAGNDLMASLREQRREMLENASRQYDRTYAQLRNEPVSQTGNMTMVDEIRNALEAPEVAVPYDVLPANTRARLQQLDQMLSEGKPVTQQTLEQTRARINTDMAAALRQGGLDERDMNALLAAFDDWRSNTIFDAPSAQLLAAGASDDAVEAFREAARAATRQRDITQLDPLINRFERDLGARGRAPVAAIRQRVAMARDLEESRAMYHEAQNLFGRQARVRLSTDFDGDVGRRDLSQMERMIEAERSGENAMRGLFGNMNGSLREGSLATLQKIRRLGTQRISTSEVTGQGRVRSPGRLALGTNSDPLTLNANLTRARRFMADNPQAPWANRPIEGLTGVQLPTQELQAARRGYLRILVEEMDTYINRALSADPGKAGLAPFRTLASKFDRMLTGEGRRVTELLFTEGEIQQLSQARRWLHRVTPPTGTAPVSSPAVIQAMWDGLQTLLSKIPVFGDLVSEIVVRGRATRQAREAVKPAGTIRPMREPQPIDLSYAPGAFAGAVTREQTPDNRGLDAYSDQQLERIAGYR